MAIFQEKKKIDKLIAMDNDSVLVNKFNESGSFLTVSKKFGYSCLYLFHILCPSKINWQVIIISQAKIFNIFPGSIQLSIVAKSLSSHCNRENFDCTPNRDLQLNSLYFEISNLRDNIFLTIGYRNFDIFRLSKYRIGAENAHKKILLFQPKEQK